MAFLVGFLQICDGQFGVVLEGFQTFVAQEFLDVVTVGATADELSRATAPEGVGRDINLQPTGFALTMD